MFFLSNVFSALGGTLSVRFLDGMCLHKPKKSYIISPFEFYCSLSFKCVVSFFFSFLFFFGFLPSYGIVRPASLSEELSVS